MKFFRLFVVLVDGSSCRAGQLDSVRGDACQNGLKVESRAYRLTDFAERLEFSYRACQFIGSLIQFFEQPDVLDSDHGLIGKGFKELDLLVSERLGLPCGGSMITPIGSPFPQQRRHKKSSNTEPNGSAIREPLCLR